MSSEGSGDEDASAQEETLRAPPAPPRVEETRFTPGTIIASRYRIVSLLAAGGMGEVYRADDMRLGQRVALKYLPPALSRDRASLERIYAEVRIGRQVSHPNVCRLYDLIEVDGHHLIAMEYVDGEDLASLLRRIGRLPGDKAVALARDVCSGLAAAHDRGVIHRDLKPANIMIDGGGNARITDFGLAALADDAARRREIAGTPPYMAPEQLTGGEATPRSDIYALGLVLYEMFTGARVFEGRTIDAIREEHARPKSRPSSLIREMDPAVERAILHCLEENPAERPPSVRSVLAALPGGDPLRAAIDAGETPSPAMVAAAGRVGNLAPRTAWILLSVLLALLAAATFLRPLISLEARIPRLKSRDALADRAREIIAASSGAAAPRDTDFRWIRNDAYLRHVAKSGARDRVGPAPSSALWFSYRESPVSLVPLNGRRVLSDDPPEIVAGMASVVVDAEGRLVRFRRVPDPAERALRATDWTPLFEEAGLDRAAFAATEPVSAVAFEHDARVAWRGPSPGAPGGQLRVEAASRRGAPVYFEVFEPWRPLMPERESRDFADHALAALFFVSLGFGCVLARRNVARGRSDRRGAFRIAVAVAVAAFLGELAIADPAGSIAPAWDLLGLLAGSALFLGASVWIVYLAAEPYVRRRWPHILISWMRLVDGRARDPLVGRDILIGSIAGALCIVVLSAATLGLIQWGSPPLLYAHLTHASMDTPLGFGYIVFGHLATAILFALGWAILLLIARFVMRRDSAAVALLVVLVTLVGVRDRPVSEFLFGLTVTVVLVAVLRLAGVVALATAFFFYYGLLLTPLTPDLSRWYALRSTAVLVMLAAIGVWAFYHALAGRPLFGALFLEDEAPA